MTLVELLQKHKDRLANMRDYNDMAGFRAGLVSLIEKEFSERKTLIERVSKLELTTSSQPNHRAFEQVIDMLIDEQKLDDGSFIAAG